MKRVFSLFLAVALLLTCGCGGSVLHAVAASYIDAAPYAPIAEDRQITHADISFSDLPDEVPNISLEIARAQELLFRIERGELCGKHARKVLNERESAYRKLCTSAAVAYVRYCFDVTDTVRKKAYDLMAVQLESLNALLLKAEHALSEDPALNGDYDETMRTRLQKALSLHDPGILPLLERERALVGEYEELAASFTISDGKRNWTKEEIRSDPSLDYETFMRLYETFETAYNTAAGTIFLELIDLRNSIARTCGYPSYAEYAYADYDRDYTPDDAKALSEQVLKTIVPLFRELQAPYYNAWMRLNCGIFRQEPTVERVHAAIVAILSELEEPWAYMTAHDLYDFHSGETRMQGSFTTYFSEYGAPFLFTSWDDSCGMPTTLLHEFGHYASYYFNGADSFGEGSLDLAEVDSQGLELLAVPQYDLLYGALSDAAETVCLFNAMYVLIAGCAEDAFQQYAYRTEDVTIEMLNGEYERLCEEFGLADLGLSAYAWTEVPHTFQSPMYYISYCTGMIAALEIFAAGDRAQDVYRTLLHRGKDERFRTFLNRVGLPDPFDPTATERIRYFIERRYTEIG